MPWLLTRMGPAELCSPPAAFCLGERDLLIHLMEKFGITPGSVFRDKSILG